MQKPRPDRADGRPPKRPGIGRPTKLLEIVVLDKGTPDERRVTVGVLICERIQMGATKKAAIGSAGVAETHAYQWISRGERDRKAGRQTPYAEFAERFARAEEHLEVGLVADIRAASRHPTRPDWRASAWLAERRLGGTWAPPAVDVTATHGLDVRTLALLRRVPTMTDEQLDEVIRTGRIAEQGNEVLALPVGTGAPAREAAEETREDVGCQGPRSGNGRTPSED